MAFPFGFHSYTVAFNASQEKIRNVKLHVDAALLRLLGYCFYVLKCEKGDFDFVPQQQTMEQSFLLVAGIRSLWECE